MGFFNDLFDSMLAVGSAVFGVAVVAKGIDTMTSSALDDSQPDYSSENTPSSSDESDE